MSKLIYLVPLFPLAGFLLNGLGRNLLSRTLVSVIAVGAVLASFVMSLLIFREVGAADFQTQVIKLFDFIKVGKVDIPFSFQVDRLSVLFLLIITGVGTLIHLYSTAYMHEENPPHYARYFAYLNLFVFSMLLLVLGSNYVIMFIGWEGVGLCSYLLIGFWFGNEAYNDAAKKAFVMNRIGDLGFLLAVFWMMMRFGTTDFAQVFDKAPEATAAVLTGITLLLFVGATGKSAQIPLFTWLPDAMAGPTPVSALIHAATMVTAGIYMITRSHVLFDLAPVTQSVIAIIGLATALLAATIALRQHDIKKVLAYSTVSQLGYMFLALGVGAYTGAIFHVMTHAFFKALLFLGAGSVIHAMHHEQDLRNMGGLWKKIPFTYAMMVVGTIALTGFPFTAGYYSKDAIIEAAYAGHNAFAAYAFYMTVIAAALTSFYSWRLIFLTFHGKTRADHHTYDHAHILHAMHEVPGWVPWLPTVMMAGGFAVSYWFYIARPDIPAALAKSQDLLYRFLLNKWYFDETYDFVFVRPAKWIGRFLWKKGDGWLIDGFGPDGVSARVLDVTRNVVRLQTGYLYHYAFVMLIGVAALITWFLFKGAA